MYLISHGAEKELYSQRDLIILTMNGKDPHNISFFFNLMHVIYVHTIGRPSFQRNFQNSNIDIPMFIFSLENSLHVYVATSVSI